MQTIGLCRFSYPAFGGFQIEHESIAEREAFLYAPARMEERFRLFETVVLPCLRAQTDGDFDLVVVIGESLPRTHRDRLHDLTADMLQVRIEAPPPRKQREVMKEVLNKARRFPHEPCLQFRQDDDDAVSVDFVERLRRAVKDCAGLCAGNKTVGIDFAKGYIAELGAEGIAAAEVLRPMNTAALGMHVRGNCQLTIMNFNHMKMPQFMPCVNFSDTPMYLRTHNSFNDSRQGAKAIPVTPLTPQQEADFEARFALSADSVRRVFRA